jgi:hypothetical protein
MVSQTVFSQSIWVQFNSNFADVPQTTLHTHKAFSLPFHWVWDSQFNELILVTGSPHTLKFQHNSHRFASPGLIFTQLAVWTAKLVRTWP